MLTLRRRALALQKMIKQFNEDLDLVEKISDLGWEGETACTNPSPVRSLIQRSVKEGSVDQALHAQIKHIDKEVKDISRDLTEEVPPDEPIGEVELKHPIKQLDVDLQAGEGLEGENERRDLKAKLILEILDLDGYAFRDDMTDDEREALDVERQSHVLRMGMNQWSVSQLQETFESMMARRDEELPP